MSGIIQGFMASIKGGLNYLAENFAGDFNENGWSGGSTNATITFTANKNIKIGTIITNSANTATGYLRQGATVLYTAPAPVGGIYDFSGYSGSLTSGVSYNFYFQGNVCRLDWFYIFPQNRTNLSLTDGVWSLGGQKVNPMSQINSAEI